MHVCIKVPFTNKEINGLMDALTIVNVSTKHVVSTGVQKGEFVGKIRYTTKDCTIRFYFFGLGFF